MFWLDGMDILGNSKTECLNMLKSMTEDIGTRIESSCIMGEKKDGQSSGTYQMDFFTLTPLFEPPR